MRKSLISLFVLVLALALAGCGQTSGFQPKTAEELLNQTKRAMEDLKQVHTSVVYDDSSVTSEPVTRESRNVHIQSDVQLQPLLAKEQMILQQPGQEPKKLDIFHADDQVVAKNKEGEWEQLTAAERSELTGAIVPFTAPVFDVSLLEPFIENAELEKIDYGYALYFEFTPSEYKQFIELIAASSGVDSDRFIHTHTGFPVIDKMELELTVNENTFFVTGFKLNANVTSYFGRDYVRYKQKLNATYSYFNDIDPIQIPAPAAELVKQKE